MASAIAGRPSAEEHVPIPWLRVVHVIHSLGPGGAESVLVELADVARTAGLDLAVIALSPAPRPVHAQALRARAVPVLELDLPRWDPRAVSRTAAALRAHRPHLVHSHLKHADLVAAVAGSLVGVPVVSTLHVVEDAPQGAVAKYKRNLGLAVRRHAAARTIALSTRQREWYQQLTGSDKGLVVLPNGVAAPRETDINERDRLRRELGVGQGGCLIVSASLMRPEKGHELLLDAISLLPADVRPVVALAGDGELRGTLEARVAARPGLREQVRFLGYRDDVPALLAAADLVLHTSLADALPTTLMQALAVGVPIVATRVGGIPDIVGSDAGLLTSPDAQHIAAAVTRLLRDDRLRASMGVAGRSRFLERFEATGWAERLRDLYDTVVREAAEPHRTRGWDIRTKQGRRRQSG
jgi:glycosyltransferase involved in cell wall biosynthesis